MKKHVHLAVTVILAVCAVVLAVLLALSYNVRFEAGHRAGYQDGSDAAYSKGLKTGEHRQVETLKTDPHKGVVPNLVGQNASQIGTAVADQGFYIQLGPPEQGISVPLQFVTPGGEAVTKDNAKDYRVVSQEPKADTVFDITYQKDDDGKEYIGIPNSMGIQNITVTVEKVRR